jgi:hypothetical protein
VVVAFALLVLCAISISLLARVRRRPAQPAEPDAAAPPEIIPAPPVEKIAGTEDNHAETGRAEAAQDVQAQSETGQADDQTGHTGNGERQDSPEAPAPKPRPGSDSALAGLDFRRFRFSPVEQRTNAPDRAPHTEAVPTPRSAGDDVEQVEDAQPEETTPQPAPAGEPAPPYPGAARALPDGSSPSAEYRVKASLAAKRYYTADSPYFNATTAQVWFRSAQDAERAGFTSFG